MPEAEIFYCPYCGEEDLRDDEAGWRCGTCRRAFAVHLAAIGSILRERDAVMRPPNDQDMPATAERDRDPQGRARNARSRDRLGRPLARGQVGVEPWPDDARLSPAESLMMAQARLDRGWPFQAHEVLESAWKSAPPSERRLWQGLAQLAVGLTHSARGNSKGAAALLYRACASIGPYRGQSPYGIDVDGLLLWTHAAQQRLESGSGGPIEFAPPALRRVSPQERASPDGEAEQGGADAR